MASDAAKDSTQGMEAQGTKEESSTELHGHLNKEQVELALQNVDHIFGAADSGWGSGSGAASNRKDSVGEGKDSSRHHSKRTSSGSGSYLPRRDRVDSSARPVAFMQAITSKASGRLSQATFSSFSKHGINEGALRHRMQSKCIDDKTIDRVRTDFGPHDRLSDKELASLDEMVTQAHKLHMETDDVGAERIYKQVLQADPVNYDCLSNLAKINYSRGNLQEAHDLFERAIVVRPLHDKTVYHLAVVLYDMKHHERSKSLFEEVVQGYQGACVCVCMCIPVCVCVCARARAFMPRPLDRHIL